MKNWYRNPYLWLFLAGALARLIGAWLFTCNYSSDHSVPCLMSKHIVEGRPIPAFYYGQPYMGSLEPIVGALLYTLPFSRHFNCNLSTAVFGILLLPLIAWWGHCVGGRKTGTIALACAIIGPPVYVQFMNWPYGGYAATVFLVTAGLLYGLSIIRMEREQSGSASVWRWVFCGLLTGLAWWTNPLSMLGMSTLVILGIVCLGFRCIQWKLIPAALAFLLGSLPFWIWNYNHQGEAVHFLTSDSGLALVAGFRRFLYGLAGALVDVDSNVSAVALLLAFAGFFVIALITWRANRKTDANLYLAAAWVLLAAALFFFIRKPLRIGPARYFLPVMPALAVIFGHSMAFLNRRLPFRPGWFVLAALVLVQMRFVPTCVQWYLNRHAYFAELEALRPFFEQLEGDVIFTEYVGGRKYGHGLNLYFDEAWCFTELPSFERCPYYVLKGDRAESVAVLRDKNGLTRSAADSGYTCRNTILPDGLLLQDRFVPPMRTTAPIPDGWMMKDLEEQRDITAELSDGNSRTRWQNSRRYTNQTLQITFSEPRNVEKIRLVAEHGAWPESLRIDVRHAGSEVLEPVGPVHDFTPWYWPDYTRRPYALGDYYRQEVQTALTNVTALQLTFNERNPSEYIEISELQLFTGKEAVTNGTSPADGDDIQALIAALDSNRSARVYCDRWTSSLLHNRLEKGYEDLRLSLEPEVWGDDPLCLPAVIALDSSWTMVVRPENAPLSRTLFRRLKLSFTEKNVSGWIVFSVQPSECYADGLPVLEWKGYGPQLMLSAEAARSMCCQAETSIAGGAENEAEEIIQRLLFAWPDYLPALKLQSGLAKRRSNPEAWRDIERHLAELETPQIPTDIRFGNGIILRGISMQHSDLKPGDDLSIRYYWTIPSHCYAGSNAVFCHLKNKAGETILSDDHVLLDELRSVRNTDAEAYVEERLIRVPEDLPPGAYHLYTGLFLSNPPYNRIPVHTDLPRKNNSVQMPVVITIHREG